MIDRTTYKDYLSFVTDNRKELSNEYYEYRIRHDYDIEVDINTYEDYCKHEYELYVKYYNPNEERN